MSVSKRVGVTYRDARKVVPYEKALREVGIEPVLIRPGDAVAVEGLDGLLLTGGTDVNAKLYRQEPHEASDQPDDERDALEKGLLESALGRDMPVLAICRGMQLFNVVHGGTIEQHVEGHRQPGVAEAHPIGVETGTKLAQAIGPGTHLVNSRHHQIVDQPGESLRVSARSEEGYPEALEREDKKFAVAVQWHPEDLVGEQEEAKRLFQAFADSL
jgi:putative glutamine amidotransferase